MWHHRDKHMKSRNFVIWVSYLWCHSSYFLSFLGKTLAEGMHVKYKKTETINRDLCCPAEVLYSDKNNKLQHCVPLFWTKELI